MSASLLSCTQAIYLASNYTDALLALHDCVGALTSAEDSMLVMVDPHRESDAAGLVRFDRTGSPLGRFPLPLALNDRERGNTSPSPSPDKMESPPPPPPQQSRLPSAKPSRVGAVASI